MSRLGVCNRDAWQISEKFRLGPLERSIEGITLLLRHKDLMLTYQRIDTLEFVGYLDADLGECVNNRRSTTGHIFTLVGGAISSKSCKQSIATSSTTQVEVIVCYEATCQAVWLKDFDSGLRIIDSISKRLTKYYEN